MSYLKLSMSSTDRSIDLSAANENYLEWWSLNDSMEHFYPYIYVSIRDRGSMINEALPFTTGLDLDVSLMSRNNENLPWTPDMMGKWFFSDDILAKPTSDKAIQGDVNMLIMPAGVKKSVFQSKAYPAFSAAMQEMKTELMVPASKGLIVPPTNTIPSWNRVGTGSQALKKWAEYSYNTGSPSSGYYTFMNRLGDLYFAPLASLLKQPKVASLYFSQETANPQTKETIPEENKFIKLTRNDVGFDVLKPLYNPLLVSFDLLSGAYISTPSPFDTHLFRGVGGRPGKYKMKMQDKPVMPTDYFYYGEQNQKNGIDTLMRGKLNYFMREVELSYRLEGVLLYNPRVAAGTVVELFTDSNIAAGFAPEYSGNWLVIETGIIDKKQKPSIPLMSVKLGRSTLDIRPTNIKKEQYV